MFGQVKANVFKFNIRNINTRCEICSKLTMKTPEQRQRCRFSVLVDNFEHVLHLVRIADFEKVNAHWEKSLFHFHL